MKDTTSFPVLLESFFTKRLIAQRRASLHTIGSYRDTFRLLLQFAEKRLGKAPSRLTLEDLQAPFLGAFLDNLESARANATRSRNLRLAAIRSFFRYIALEAPRYSGLIQRVLIGSDNHGRLVDDDPRRFGFHNLRHSLASFLIRIRTDPKTVQTLLRHSDVKLTLQFYTHAVSRDRMVAAGKMLTAILSHAPDKKGLTAD